MKLYAPNYYKKFKCIADKCDHSCCVGWEIDVDPEALEKYKSAKGAYGSAVLDSIVMDETPHFKLESHERCPHLNENGLCKIILELGEDYLCGICREHPRFYNYTSVAEVGIGMSCTEAARIILSSPDYAELECIGESNIEPDCIDFDGRAVRHEIYRVLTDKTRNYSERLTEICQRYSINIGEDSIWLNAIDSLEYLDESHRRLFMKYSSGHLDTENNEYRERFLAYFIYRHVTEAFDIDDLRSRLSFCLFCERLFTSLITSENAKSLNEIAVLARIISEEIEYSDDNTVALTELAEAQ
ncbi:MAG: flagellin lysine-N-methylase [Clostridia bacterium]|nr:flagellin lysine-N-methylase [Clostridia bacterium]